MSNQEQIIKDKIILKGKRLYDQGLVVANSGNISAKLDSESILLTASQTHLGNLDYDSIIKVNLNSNASEGKKVPSSELPLHSLVYKNFNDKVVIHCHPPLINGYFSVKESLRALTFETDFYLGKVPVIPQSTPTVTEPEPVIEALKSNNIVVLKNHGVIAKADDFQGAINLIEALEEAIKVVAVARLFDKNILDDLDKPLKQNLDKAQAAYPMFSKEHIQAIVDLVNKDEFIAQKGKELELTVKLVIKLKDSDRAYRFNFENGKIIKLDSDPDAPFVISASKEVWEQVFLGRLDSFVAVTQGKMKLEGQLGQLSRWYVPFTRLFDLFKEVRFVC